MLVRSVVAACVMSVLAGTVLAETRTEAAGGRGGERYQPIRAPRLLLLLAGLAPLPAAPASAEAPMVLGGTGVLGGPGGDGYVLMCPGESFLIGVDVRAGAVIDAVRPACGAIDRSTMQVTHRLKGLPHAGGPGGEGWRRVHCPMAGMVVIELGVHVKTAGITVVSAFQARCTTVAGRPDWAMSDFARWMDEGDQGVGFARCPSGQWAKGLYGTAGKYVDSIGLVCAPALEPLMAQPETAVIPETVQPSSDGMFEEKLNPNVFGN